MQKFKTVKLLKQSKNKNFKTANKEKNSNSQNTKKI